MKSGKKIVHHLILFVFAIFLLSVAAFFNQKITDLRKTYPSFTDPVFLPKAEALRLVSLDFEGLAADLVWIKGALYFGSHYRQRGFRFRWMEGLLNLATDLDPLYYDIYWYGSSLLPEVHQSIRLLEKGMRYFPDKWELPQMIGFYYLYYLHDYKSAAKYYEIASLKPGRPPFVPSLASRFYTQAGELDAAIRVLKGFYETTHRKDLKKEFALRITQLEQIKYLQALVQAYRESFGAYPATLKDLQRRGLLNAPPREPFGGYYFIDPKNHRVKSSTDPLVTPPKKKDERWQKAN